MSTTMNGRFKYTKTTLGRIYRWRNGACEFWGKANRRWMKSYDQELQKGEIEITKSEAREIVPEAFK